jgi:hypothetical protein
VNLREHAAKKLTEQVLGDCEEEYQAMWHNASFRGEWPDYGPEDQQHFWDWLNDEVDCMIANLQAEILEEYTIEMHLTSFGRGGATIAPTDFSTHKRHYFNRKLYENRIADWDDYEHGEEDQEDGVEWWVEAYKKAQAHLAAFKLINQRVRAGAAGVAQAWRAYQEYLQEAV